jgi:hypothetical protein
MPVQSHIPLSHSNQYNAESACGHCEGVVRHEPWCVTQNASVQYAYRALSDPGHLSTGDQLILHALGAAWTPNLQSFPCAAQDETGRFYEDQKQSVA